MKEEKTVYEAPEIEIIEMPQDLLKSGDPVEPEWDEL